MLYYFSRGPTSLKKLLKPVVLSIRPSQPFLLTVLFLIPVFMNSSAILRNQRVSMVICCLMSETTGDCKYIEKAGKREVEMEVTTFSEINGIKTTSHKISGTNYPALRSSRIKPSNAKALSGSWTHVRRAMANDKVSFLIFIKAIFYNVGPL